MFQLLCALLLTFTSITMSDYNQIEVGSTSEFVHGLLGPCEGVWSNENDELGLIWQEDDRTIIVTFKNDKVVSKVQYGLED